MIKTSTLAGVATLALAALPMFALATAANAATPVAVKVADIDTLSPEGARIYDQRVDKAAVRFCRINNANSRLTERVDCQNAVHAEMSDKLEARNTELAARKGAQMAQK